jgi:hypothetical protein
MAQRFVKTNIDVYIYFYSTFSVKHSFRLGDIYYKKWASSEKYKFTWKLIWKYKCLYKRHLGSLHILIPE